MGKVGNRARLKIQRPPRDLVEKFREAGPPDLAEAMGHSNAMREIRPIFSPMPRCVGTAITVKVQPGDALMVQKALEVAEAGDVLVVDGRGTIGRSVWGGNRSMVAAAKGLAGVVIDGACRDADETRSVNLPMFARALCPMGSGKLGPGELNFPIACGGVVVNPGDIVVADEEGIVVIPWQDAEDVYKAWRKVADKEQVMQATSATGKQVAPNLEKGLIEIGCEIV